MYCTTVGTVLKCAMVFFYIVFTTTTTFNVTTENTTKPIIICNDTVVVYLDGYPVYTIIGKACITVVKLADSFTIINNTVYFWDVPTNVTLYAPPKRPHRFPLWPFAVIILLLRKIFSVEFEG